MNVDPATGMVKLDAEAPSFDHALAYVQVLDEVGSLQPAIIVSHEPSVDPTGRSAVKFSATTRWVAP